MHTRVSEIGAVHVKADDAGEVDPSSPRATAGQDGVVPPSRPQSWHRRYARRLFVSDLVALVWVVFGTQIAWFGFGDVQLVISEDHNVSVISYWAFSVILIILWMWSLALSDSRSHRVIGSGSAEYLRIADSSFRLFGAIAIVAFLAQIPVARGYLLISLPLGIAVLLLERWLWRQWLIAKRVHGEYSARVLLVGSPSSVSQVARELARTPTAGYVVVGACTPEGQVGTTIPGTDVRVMSAVDDVSAAMAATGADTVAITSTDELSPDRVKQISWGLEAGRQHLVLTPSITDVAGPRIHIRPVAGLPLVHVETPRFTAGQKFVKRAFDVVGSALLIILASPLLIVLAVVVKVTSEGPILYRSRRIGLNGQPFDMLKFRSMRVGADKELAALLKAQGTEATPLFKVKDDPRITPIGRFIRKYSLDELPQLFNALGGSMSLVGPRPQIAAEVALYSDAAKRRLLTRPGLTGMWQVSGRSTLDWEQTVRLDLYYVENWTLLGDFVILAKTVKAVLSPGETAH